MAAETTVQERARVWLAEHDIVEFNHIAELFAAFAREERARVLEEAAAKVESIAKTSDWLPMSEPLNLIDAAPWLRRRADAERRGE